MVITGWTVSGLVLFIGVILGGLIGQEMEQQAQERRDLRLAAERKARARPIWRRGYLSPDGRLTTLTGAAFFHGRATTGQVTRALWQFSPPRTFPEQCEWLARVSGSVAAQRAAENRRQLLCLRARHVGLN